MSDLLAGYGVSCSLTEAWSSIVLTCRSFDIFHQPVKDLDVAVDRDVDFLHALRVRRQVLCEVAHLLHEQIAWTREVLFHCAYVKKRKELFPQYTEHSNITHTV